MLKQYSVEDVLKELEEMPSGTIRKLKFANIEAAKSHLERDVTEIEFAEHVAEIRGYEEGYADAVEKYREWRNDLYLKIKKLKSHDS